MNASGRLNTCKSRGSGGAATLLPATGARVSNAYATCPPQGDNREKSRLIPHIPWGCMALGRKGYRRGMGMRGIRKLAGQRPTNPSMPRGSERKVPHTGTETRARLLREAAVRNIGQWAGA